MIVQVLTENDDQQLLSSIGLRISKELIRFYIKLRSDTTNLSIPLSTDSKESRPKDPGFEMPP